MIDIARSLRYVELVRQRGVDYRSSARLRFAMTESDERERKELGAHLKKVREAAGYTLRSAADELTERGHAIGFGAIGAWEDGRNVPNALWISRLARLYGVPVDALFSEEKVSVEVIRLAAQLRDVVRKQEGALESIGSLTRSSKAKRGATRS